MYQRVGAAAYKEGLHGILTLCERLGNPQEGLKYIHIAGTNGKGSTSHFMASLLQEAGYKTGLYTSPHLIDFRERIKVNGDMVSREFVVNFTQENRSLFEELKPSFFEMTLAMAFVWFKKQNTDIVVLETGMGGRLDSTNVITPILSVITNIGMDHMKFLGDTPAKIAFEKAGIIKHKTPVIIGETTPETRPVFEATAKSKNAPVLWAEQETYTIQLDSGTFELQCKNGETILFESGLTGSYQAKNINTVYSAFNVLQKTLPSLTVEHLKCGIRNVIKNTGLRGRWEKLQSSPTLICDIGHNEHGFREIMTSLSGEKYHQLWMVIGFVNDKDIAPILSMLPKEAKYIFTRSGSPRSLEASEIARVANTFDLTGEVITPVRKAVEYALQNAASDDFIFLGGSTFVVADYLEALQNENNTF
jgi:dihydrofolate synthase/folylpolyglutamate synthase